MRLALPPTLRRALPALLTVWGAALLAIAVIDWGHYGVFLRLVMIAR